MAKNETVEKMDLTGLSTSEEPKATEFDLVSGLLAAADFKNDEDLITIIDIKRNGKHYFSFRVHPVSDKESKMARKKATTYMKNPNNAKLPPIEKDIDTGIQYNWLIYLATVDEDRAKIWGNAQIKDKYNLIEDAESVGVLLMAGEKLKIVNTIMDISGMNDDDDVDPEDYAKN